MTKPGGEIRNQKDQLQLKRATLLRRKSGILQIQKVIKPSLLSTAVGAISPRIAKIQKSKMGQVAGWSTILSHVLQRWVLDTLANLKGWLAYKATTVR